MIAGYPSHRVFFNILGGSLTLLSVQLSWVSFFGFYPALFQSGGVYAVALYWALAGAVLSFLSRYGGIMTIVGLFAFLGEPYAYFGAQPGIGLLVALFGAILTFAGVKWSIPNMMRGREILGGILYSIGFLTILSLFIGSFLNNGLYVGLGRVVSEVPLYLVGAFVTLVGLKLFLSPERRRESPIGVLARPT